MSGIAMDSQWNHEANTFAMDNSDYEKAFETYISDVEDDDDIFLKTLLKAKSQTAFNSNTTMTMKLHKAKYMKKQHTRSLKY
ncbi:CLUMA_CG021667, isoform A [Clunio marinus]|uniref:CLUMA_CG021667, isoform A n=1 Tax=Clunio marinus TaxID=568069 RepID=A0A1J1J8H8_9DIPT|nr:CLUMA_CG021667, isoform A [Clunio marinus]